MKKYIICYASNQAELQDEVQRALDAGYELHGSMSVIVWETPHGEYQRQFEYNQPMILKENEK